MASATWNFPLKFSSNPVSTAWDMVSTNGARGGEGGERWGEEDKETEGEGPAHTLKKGKQE